MPAKPLTSEQKADAARLKAAFLAYQERLKNSSEPHAQDEIAAKLPFGQSAMNQYLNGKIPLNAEALLEFCRLMDVTPGQISPSITQREQDWSLKWVNPAGYTGKLHSAPQGAQPAYEIPHDIVSALAGLEGERATIIVNAMRGMLGLSPSADSGNAAGRQTAPPKSATG